MKSMVKIMSESLEGNEFSGCTGDHQNNRGEVTITVEEDMEITANFEEDTHPTLWYGLIILVVAMGIIGFYLVKSRFEY